jgi:TolB-like protein/Tfp pilus assembly protein PilF
MPAQTTTFGGFVLDRRRQELTLHGNVVPIGHRGYVLLETLLDAGGDAVDKTTLIERVWPGMIVEESNLSVQIAALRRHLGAGAETMIITVPRVGYRFIAPAPSAPGAAGPPLVAVLPFSNLSTEAEQGYFADGVVDDIITALSRFKHFGVLSRGSTFALRDAPGDAWVAAAKMGVRYALEGSVRRQGERMRVSAHLVDASSGAQLWAEKFDGAAVDIFAFQDRITESVVGVIEPEIRRAEIQRARRKPPHSLDAYDLYLRALPLVFGALPTEFAAAIALLRQAATLDPGFALAPAYAAWCYEKRMSLGAAPLAANDLDICLSLARKGLELGGDDPLVRGVCGWVLSQMGGETAGRDALFQAMEANPNNTTIVVLAGVAYGHQGSFDESWGCFLRAYQLSPGAPDAYQPLEGVGTLEVARGNYETAIEWLQRSLAARDDWPYTYYSLAAAYAYVDRMDEARTIVKRLREISPHATLESVLGTDRTNDDPVFARLLPGLRKAGLPER